MAVSVIKRSNAYSVRYRTYDNATMSQIMADCIEQEVSFIINQNLDASKKPSGITAAFYYAIIPKNMYISGAAFAIVWSNVDSPHVVGFG